MPCSAQATISHAPKMVASSGSRASAKTSMGVRNSTFTYTVKVTCPTCKTGQTPPTGPAVLTVQLPAGYRLARGIAPKTVATLPVADANNLVTWTVPNLVTWTVPTLPSKAWLTLVIQSTSDVCVPAPNLVGQLCLANACQALPLRQSKIDLGGY